MGKYRVKIEKLAENHLQTHYISGNRAIIKRIEVIFQQLTENPYEGIGKPEPLKHGLSGYWSRRISKKDRMVYRIDNEIVMVFVVSALGHYND